MITLVLGKSIFFLFHTNNQIRISCLYFRLAPVSKPSSQPIYLTGYM